MNALSVSDRVWRPGAVLHVLPGVSVFTELVMSTSIPAISRSRVQAPGTGFAVESRLSVEQIMAPIEASGNSTRLYRAGVQIKVLDSEELSAVLHSLPLRELVASHPPGEGISASQVVVRRCVPRRHILRDLDTAPQLMDEGHRTTIALFVFD